MRDFTREICKSESAISDYTNHDGDGPVMETRPVRAFSGDWFCITQKLVTVFAFSFLFPFRLSLSLAITAIRNEVSFLQENRCYLSFENLSEF
ncbi:hypothetical protein AAC387_Pa02g5092 [Persea americana]